MRKGDIVIALPGITGSVLARRQVPADEFKDVLALSFQAGLGALRSGGDSIRKLALGDDPVEEDDVDGVSGTRILRVPSMIPILSKSDGYGAMIDGLTRLVPKGDLHEFPYDWRRDNRVAARQLAAKVNDLLHRRRQDVPGARVVLVGHSMGGLVARYFVEVLGGWRDTRNLITVGTPYYGSVNAADFLLNGFRKLHGLVDLSDVLRSFTSIYQLLPTFQCVGDGTSGYERLSDLTELPPSLAGKAKYARAVSFHREITSAVLRHQDDADYRANGYALNFAIGIGHPTSQSVVLRNDGTCVVSRERRGTADDDGHDLGDGTVPRISAAPQEAESDSMALYSGARHASMQNTGGFLTGVHGILTAQSHTMWRGASPGLTISLDLDDVYARGEPVSLSVEPSEPDTPVRVSVESVEAAGSHAESAGAQTIARHIDLGHVDGATTVELPPGPPGLYRLTVHGPDDFEPVTDLFIQAPD